MIKAHIYIDGEFHLAPRLEHCPRNGETLRIDGADGKDRYVVVTEVIWCMNEKSAEGQRVNIRTESEGSGKDE